MKNDRETGTVWTEEELTTFDSLSMATESHDQMTRIKGRLDMNSFVSRHGKVKCDAMWAEILRREKASRSSK